MEKLTLSEIWIYPVKSLGGIRLTTAKVLPKGLQYDRRYMLVDDTNQFMTQRRVPAMALFKLSMDKDSFTVSHNGSSIQLPFSPEQESTTMDVTIWDDSVQAFELGREYSKWFSERLQQECKLVFFPEANDRLVDPTYALNEEHVGLADGYPFLVIGQRSLDDLNSRLKDPVPMNRFRPNFVFTGGAPFEEDTWRNFTIGKNRFVAVKKCARCVLTTVDQDTAQKGAEPLLTLSKYRNVDNKVLFGNNLLAIDHLEVNEGESITIESFV